MKPRCVVVIGSDKAAQIAAASAQKANPAARVLLLGPNDDLTLDLDARTVGRYHFDALVFCEGPIELLAHAGAVMTPEGTLLVDDTLCTSLEAVFACGHAVSLLKAVSHRRQFPLNPSMLERSAQVAGANAAMRHRDACERVRPFAGAEVVKTGDTVKGFSGLRRDEIASYFSENEVIVSEITRPHLKLSLFASTPKGTLIGAEVTGSEQVLHFLDLFSLCIMKGLCADDLVDLDVASASDGKEREPLRELAEGIKSGLLRERLARWLKEHGERTLEALQSSHQASAVALDRFFEA